MKKRPRVNLSEWILDKLNLSLTFRLNIRATMNLVGTFIKFNIIIVFSLILIFFYSSDSALLKAKDNIDGININDKIFLNDNISVYNIDEFNQEIYRNYIPFDYIFNMFSKHSDVSNRTLWIRPGSVWVNFWGLEYTLEVNRGDTMYILGFNFLEGYYALALFMVGLFIIEFFFIIGQLFKSKKSISASLNPIHELTETVKEMNGSDLSKRISIMGTQNEFVDLTQEINAMLDRIQESYSAQSRFVSDASHELRTPIAVIQGYANLIDRWGKKDPETLTESIDAIKSETEAMKKLVEQLLFLARGDRENLSATKEPMDLSIIAEEVFNESKVIDHNHEYKLGQMIPSWIYGDTDMVKQSIRIFIDNASKYTEKNKRIVLEVYGDMNQSIVTIQDEGIGMTNHEINNMFERFFRADQARTRKDGGSGLGLSIADQILRLHNADVKVISMVNVGTKIFLSFPAVEEQKKTDIA